MLIMQHCQPLVLIFQFFKILEQGTSTTHHPPPLPQFESWFCPWSSPQLRFQYLNEDMLVHEKKLLQTHL